MSDRSFKIAVMLSAYDKMSTVINSAVDKAQRKLKGFEKAQKSLNSFGNNAMVGGGIATAFFGGTVKAARESEMAAAKMKNTFKSLGQTNDTAANAALDFASKLQYQIGIEDEVISVTQAKIATFKSLSSETGRLSGMYDRVTRAAFDMQALGFGDASSNAVQLGKALENPVMGLNALSRAGITFSDAEKKKIKILAKGNHLLEAQKMIMKALEGQGIKGAAEAAADPLMIMQIALGEIAESVGKNLLPKIKEFAKYVTTELIPKIQNFIDNHGTLIKVMAAASVGFLGMGAAAKVISFGMSGLGPVLKGVGFAFKFLGNTIGTVTKFLMANPILLAVAAIAGIVYLIYDNWGTIKKWFGKIWDSVVKVFSATWQWIKKMFLNYTPYGLIIKHWDKISAWFTGLWEKIKNIFSSVWEWIKDLFIKYNPIVIVYKHWDEIVAYFTGIWEKIKNVFKNAWKAIKNGIKSFFGAGDADAIANTYAKSLDAVNRSAAKGIAITAGGNVNVSNGMGGSASMGLRPVPVNSNASHYNYAPNIILNGSATPQDAQAFMNYTKKDIIKTMKEESDRKVRSGY